MRTKLNTEWLYCEQKDNKPTKDKKNPFEDSQISPLSKEFKETGNITSWIR